VLEKLRTSPIAARALLVLLRRQAELVQPTATLRLSRDSGDDKFLECAVAGRADYIVSADADLLTLSAIQGIPILDAPDFRGEIARGEPVKRLDQSRRSTIGLRFRSALQDAHCPTAAQ
jgi:predicted nucleic acid-binding protein